MHGCSFGRSVEGREGKFISRISIDSSRNKALPTALMEAVRVINLPPGSWMTPWGMVLCQDSGLRTNQALSGGPR